MPADYQSTARALSLPISPIGSPSPESPSYAHARSNSRAGAGILSPSPSPDLRANSRERPVWARRSRSSSQPQNLRQQVATLQKRLIRHGLSVQKRAANVWRKLTLLQKILAVLGSAVLFTLSILFLINNEKVFGWLAPYAQTWRDVPFGWIVLWLMTFFCAFPPLIGYSMSVTIAGFVYGFPNGWFIVATANVAGSLASFIACRTILSGYVQRFVGEDKRFQALGLTLKHDGLKVLCMVRLCPLPYSISNGAMATFPTLDPMSFALATALVSPKLLVHVFIGSRLASIAENGGKMDAATKAVNYISIAVGSIVGAGVGWVIYQRTMARARELEIEEVENIRRRGGNPEDELGEDIVEDAAALMDNDDISLWGADGMEGGYQDEFTDEEDRPRDEEHGLGSNASGKR